VKAGLEVHQQLATGKLFCDCPTELSEIVVATATRRLRATGGENHAVDRAAAFQASRGWNFRYEATPTSCLVELDEEPPHALNREAVDVALTVALLLHARPVDEIEVMRKIVVDGSNTSGFQRTTLIAVDGYLEVAGRRYSILSICLEEDAARKVGETSGELTFRLDRLGIPLIEIATGPEITNGSEAREVAEEIGAILRSTRRVRRGIGTIREDLNVSTEGGARVEIKGVQELRLLHKFADGEEGRQRTLLKVRDRLVERRASVPSDPPVDVTHLVAAVAQGGFGDALRRKGIALGIALRGFSGLLRPDADAPERLGRELADVARTRGVRGLVHSDELPGYGLDAALVQDLRAFLGAEREEDAFLIVAAPDAGRATFALDAVRDRARSALEGIPGETRDPLPDGRTRYSRPLPGRDRMYPETDVPPVPVDPLRLHRLREHLPPTPRELRQRLADQYGLSEELVRPLQRDDEIERFEALVAKGHPSSLVARLLTQELTALAGPDGEIPIVPMERLDELLMAVREGRIAKEGIGPVLRAFADGTGSVDQAIARTGLVAVTSDELDRLAEEIVRKNAALLSARGDAAFAPLMGDLMREVRGRRDGKEVSEALRRAIQAVKAPPAPEP
jgi:glutamyl-tRNA(Gln) amidotransferase subunit E